ncbi:MAG: DUF4435 domain-containing protein [Agathobacter sp.]
MLTKERLIKDRERANVSYLRLMQTYNPSSNCVYLVVEGKDDIAYYTCIQLRYCQLADCEIIQASNRVNVIKTYEAIDWNVYSSKRILFFVDRDLSEITGEYTPEAKNIYVTDYYSIENSLFTENLLFVALRVYYGVEDLSLEEKEAVSALYRKALEDHERVFMPIMCWILQWRLAKIPCNLNNLNSGDFYKINQGVFEVKAEYQEPGAVVDAIHNACGVYFVDQDLSPLETAIESHGGIRKCIRGKYVKCFFVKFLLSIAGSMQLIFPNRNNPKAIVTIGPNNALQLLCGYMETPHSLNEFLLKATT